MTASKKTIKALEFHADNIQGLRALMQVELGSDYDLFGIETGDLEPGAPVTAFIIPAEGEPIYFMLLDSDGMIVGVGEEALR